MLLLRFHFQKMLSNFVATWNNLELEYNSWSCFLFVITQIKMCMYEWPVGMGWVHATNVWAGFFSEEPLKIHANDCQEENLYTIIQKLHLD